MDFGNNLDGIFKELNYARCNPREFGFSLGSLQTKYKGNLFNENIKTREGVKALRNLIQQLIVRPASNKLKWSFALHMAADEQASILGETGSVTTQGTSSFESLPSRCKKYAIVRGRLSQVYEFGGKSAQQILEWLLIDDGLASRKRRNTLLDPIFNYIGIGSCFHEVHGTVTVIILAEDLVSLVAPQGNGKYRIRRPVQREKQTKYHLEEQILIQDVVSKFLPPKKNQFVMDNSKIPEEDISQYELYKNRQSSVNYVNKENEPAFIIDNTPKLSPSKSNRNQHDQKNLQSYVDNYANQPSGESNVTKSNCIIM